MTARDPLLPSFEPVSSVPRLNAGDVSPAYVGKALIVMPPQLAPQAVVPSTSQSLPRNIRSPAKKLEHRKLHARQREALQQLNVRPLQR